MSITISGVGALHKGGIISIYRDLLALPLLKVFFPQRRILLAQGAAGLSVRMPLKRDFCRERERDGEGGRIMCAATVRPQDFKCL